MNHPKVTRAVDKALLEAVKVQRCAACSRSPCDPHHVTSRGAGGGDVPNNVMPLCHMHHQEWHKAGPVYMFKAYRGVFLWLFSNKREDVLSKEFK